MKREDCWMTFSEALEMYLVSRSEAVRFGSGSDREEEKEKMKTAADHMNALTGNEGVLDER